jgi:hypothetical protein
MPTPISQGDVSLREIDGSPEWHITIDAYRLTRKFMGPWSQINPLTGLYNSGAIGSAMADLPAGYFITDLKPRCLQTDGAGELTVEIENINNPGWNSPIFDLEWVALEKDLLLNPRYINGAHSLTTADLVDLARWRTNGPIDNSAGKYKYNLINGDGSATIVTLSANAQDAAAKLNAGTTSWRDWYPVVSAETYSMPGIFGATPVGWQGGKRENPVNLIAPSPFANSIPIGYTWVRSACRISFQRWRYSQRREWLGLTTIDTDLYPAA